MLNNISYKPLEIRKKRGHTSIASFAIPSWMKGCTLIFNGKAVSSTPAAASSSAPDVVLQALEGLASKLRQAVAVDTETDSNNVFTTNLTTVTIAWSEKEVLMFEVRLLEMSSKQTGQWVTNPSLPKFCQLLKAVFENHDIVMQNKNFDERVLTRELGPYIAGNATGNAAGNTAEGNCTENYEFKAARDTMLAAYLEDGGQPNGLKDLGQSHLHLGVIELESVDFTVPEQRLYYSTQDALLTWRLDEYFIRKGVYKMPLFKIEMEVADVIKEMEGAGIRVDVEEVKRQQVIITKEVQDLEEEIYKLAGRKFKIDSSAQVGKVLFQELGIANDQVTSKGKPSTRAEVLESMDHVHPIISLILKYRHKQKLKSQYLDGIFEYIRADGKIHTAFLQNVVPTGRLQSKDPNLMQIPVDNIRKCYVADEGYVLAYADYKQIEFRYLCSPSISNCLPAINTFKAGKDSHRICASVLYEKPEADVLKSERNDSKTLTYGIIFGMEYWGLAARQKISNAEARERMDKWFGLWRGTREWIEKEKREGLVRGGSRTFFGRHRKIAALKSPNPKDRSRALRNLVNDAIQGGAADIIKSRMKPASLSVRAIGGSTLMMLHDALLFQIPIGKEKESERVICESMLWQRKGFIPMEVEVKFGPSWGDMHEIGSKPVPELVRPQVTMHAKFAIGKRLQQALLSCGINGSGCSARADAKAPIPFKGSLASRIMFVGRNGGRDENQAGLPFVGRGGKLLDEWFSLFGFERKKIYITNLVKCYTLNDRPPTEEEVKICRDKWLVRELKLLRPDVIVLMGNQCVRAILGTQTPSLTRIHGSVFEKPMFGKKVKFVAMYHPGYCLRNPEAAKQAVEDIAKLKPVLSAYYS